MHHIYRIKIVHTVLTEIESNLHICQVAIGDNCDARVQQTMANQRPRWNPIIHMPCGESTRDVPCTLLECTLNNAGLLLLSMHKTHTAHIIILITISMNILYIYISNDHLRSLGRAICVRLTPTTTGLAHSSEQRHSSGNQVVLTLAIVSALCILHQMHQRLQVRKTANAYNLISL